MARGQAQAADSQRTLSNSVAAGQGANAQQLYGTLTPAATGLVNSTGYDPATLSAITNAGMGAVNSAFGDTAGAIAKNAAVTKNPASVNAALDANAINKGTAAGSEAGQIQMANAAEKDMQRQLGLNVLNSMYGTNVNAQTSNLGNSVGSLQARAAGPSGAQDFASIASGITGGFQPIHVCWVAAELYGGWDAPQVALIREWLLGTWYMRPFVAVYKRFGRTWAEWIRKDADLRRITKSVFDLFLREAYGA